MNNPQPFFDIYDFYYIPWWQTKPFIYTALALGFFLVALLAYLVARYIRSKRKCESLPWEWAKDKIVILALEEPSKKEEYKRLYVDLIEITKQYLFLRFDWKVSTYTDDELIIFVKKQNEKIAPPLEKIIDNARMIKFANEQALQNHLGDALEAALDLVEKTKKHEEKT